MSTQVKPRSALTHKTLRWVAWVLPAVALVSLWFAAARRDLAPSFLQLEEISSIRLPDAYQIKGAHVSPGGRVVLWSINQPNLLVYDGPDFRTVQSPLLRKPVAARLTSGDSLLEAVDAERRAIVRLTLQGHVVDDRPLELPWTVESAIHSDSGWIVGGRDVAGNYRVVALERSGGRRLLTVPAKRYAGTPISMSLSESGGDVFATMLRPPHLVTRIQNRPRREGPAEPQTSLRTPGLPKEPRSEPALWVALAVLPLDTGFIRTFADLRSDQRVLATYDKQGRLLRHSVLDVPMAVLATVPARRMLVAARRTDRLELVFYEWRWTGHSPS